MADEKTCPHCGKPVPTSAPGGICPECMLKAGIQTEGPGSAHAVPPPDPAELAALFPQLEILHCLGRGGMGVVYQARQPRLNRLVALKILLREKDQDGKFAERFAREAQALARLNHPNIVTVHDFGEAGGHFYLLMEFVDGLSLRQLLQAGTLEPEQALKIVPKICEALQYAHEQGIVHRDIKPENILLDKQGRVKIADFGIAKVLATGSGLQPSLTGAKDVVGTPHYMAPEQIEKPMTVDHRADIYSLGVVFYEMLTGELPLGKFQPPSSCSRGVHVDVRLDEVVLRALAKEPERRYQHVSEVKTDVETIAGSASPRTVPISKPANELPKTVGAPAIIFMLAFVILAGYLAFSAGSLPLRVATHFDGEWRPNGWMERTTYLIFMGVLPLLFPLIFTLIRFLPIPANRFNLPNREYWLAPERRHGTVTYLWRSGLWMGTLIVMFIGAMHALIIQANRYSPPRLPGAPFIILLLALLIVFMLFAIQLVFFFAEPLKASQTKEPLMKKTNYCVIAIGAVCLVAAVLILSAFHSSRNAVPKAALLTDQGWQQMQSQRRDEALASFNKAVKLDPQNANAWNGLGWASFNSGNSSEGEKAFLKAIELQPDHPAALNGLGQIYLSRKQYADAETYLLKAALSAPAAWFGLARLYLIQGKFEEALPWAQKIVESGQGDQVAQQMLQAAKDKKLSDSFRIMLEPR